MPWWTRLSPFGGWVKQKSRSMGLVSSPASSLLAKELGLQHVNLSVVLLLVLLHFAALGASHWKAPSMNSYMGMAMFMSRVLLMTLPPLLIGCVAVAEERRLGTILWHRTLPISAWKQWLIKLAVVYGLTFLTAWVLPRCLPMDLQDIGRDGHFAMTVVAFSLATLGLLVSSLSKSLLSAFGTAFGLGIAVVCGIQFSESFMNRLLHNGVPFFHSSWSFGFIHLWLLLSGISLAVGTLVLIFRNMQRVIPGKRDLLFNTFVLLGLVVASSSISWMIFFRAWEKVVPFPEPQPIVRLQGTVHPKIEGWPGLTIVLLPDGRAISPHVSGSSKTNPSFTVICTNEDGTNQTRWQDVASGYSSDFGIRDDGTLWKWGTIWRNPEREAALMENLKKKLAPTFFQSPTQIGTDSNWKKVFAIAGSGFALKKDNSLWAWGTNNSYQFGNGTTNSSSVPIQVGTDNDWIQIGGWGWGTDCVGLKSDGSLWEWGIDRRTYPARTNTIPVRLNLPADWAEIELGYSAAIGLKKDHSLWGIPRRDEPSAVYQIGHDSDWKTVGRPYTGQAFATKNDGSLWKITLSFSPSRNGRQSARYTQLEKIGHSTNWLAASDITALGADGSLIGWPYPQEFRSPPEGKKFFLAPSRLSPFVLNLARGNKP
ncbi:MAG: inlJ 1 [Verrucomicrobiales bacterium]|nr:inlJ 1 [Verrucomicrobiales bacterium]